MAKRTAAPKPEPTDTDSDKRLGRRRGIGQLNESDDTKPQDVRATIRATDGRRFTARQPGRG